METEKKKKSVFWLAIAFFVVGAFFMWVVMESYYTQQVNNLTEDILHRIYPSSSVMEWIRNTA